MTFERKAEISYIRNVWLRLYEQICLFKEQISEISKTKQKRIQTFTYPQNLKDNDGRRRTLRFPTDED